MTPLPGSTGCNPTRCENLFRISYIVQPVPVLQALHNVTTLTRATTVSAFQTLSYIAEGCIFIYVGLDTLDPIKWKVCCCFIQSGLAQSQNICSRRTCPTWTA